MEARWHRNCILFYLFPRIVSNWIKNSNSLQFLFYNKNMSSLQSNYGKSLYKESHHQLMAVPIPCLGKNEQSTHFTDAVEEEHNKRVERREKSKSIPRVFFMFFFNGNYVQTQWQWAGTLKANDCWFVLLPFLAFLAAFCFFKFQLHVAIGLNVSTSFNDFDAMASFCTCFICL